MGGLHRRRVPRICEFCDRPFVAYRTSVRRGGGKFCSRACHGQSRSKKIKVTCRQCARTFVGEPGRKYCSHACWGLAHRGSNHPQWAGGKSNRDKATRRLIVEIIRERGACENCGSREKLHGHHRHGYGDRPELRRDPANIQVLCVDCHAERHPQIATFIRAYDMQGRSP